MLQMTEDEIKEWFRAFEARVRAVDYAGARPLFAEEVVSFGTFGTILVGRQELETGQWRHVWSRIRDFRFRLDQLTWGAAGDLAWAVCLWGSEGLREDGSTFPRPGRATVILRRQNDRWLAIHTHFSLEPTPL